MGKAIEKLSCTCGEVLTIPHPNEVVEVLCPFDPEEVKADARKNYEIISKGFKVIKNLVHINIENIIEPSDDWLIFNRHNKDDRNELKHSIMNNGLFTPIILWEWFDGKYMILSGTERVDIYKELWNEAIGDEKKEYETIPSFVLGLHEINDVIARIIRIDSNICVRTMDLVCKNRAICEKYVALKKLKMFRNDFNIIDELSESFGLSRTAITNHLLTQNVIEEFFYLFQEGVLSLTAIKKLSRFSLENQRKILDGIGFKNIKECQIKLLKDSDVEDVKSLNSTVEVLKNVKESYFTTLKIKVPRKFLDDAMKLIKTLISRNKALFMKLLKYRA